jgi:hypothetical protein
MVVCSRKGPIVLLLAATVAAAACGDAPLGGGDDASAGSAAREGAAADGGTSPGAAAGGASASFFVPRPALPPLAAPEPRNSLDTVDPNFVLPDLHALVPGGVAELDEIPNTVDLAEMAAQYLVGISQLLLPENPYFHVPPGMVDMHDTPTAIFSGGAPNWGKSIQAMLMARRMSGYDLDDASGTLTPQLMSTRNMIDPNVNKNLIARGEGAWNVVTGAFPENQMTTAVEALIELYKQNPLPDLGQLVQQMIAYHTKIAVPDHDDEGEPILHYRLPTPGVSPYVASSTGSIGYGDWPFHVGKTMRALSTWYVQAGDEQALASTSLLSVFVRNYSHGVFWTMPPGFPEGTGTGHFAGHVHMYANGLMGMLWEAEARRKKDASDPGAAALIDFVKQSYFFIRDMHGGASSALGNFGEICTVGDMLRLAVRLTMLGAGDFNEDIERWVRNQIAESQIKGAITIEAHPEDPLKDRIGQKVIGTFFEDATHPLAIPDTHNDQGSLNLQLVACGLGNPVHGMFDVWQHIVRFHGDTARVNLLLNKATWYLDVKSELPYRGAVHAITRSDLGPLAALELRVPDGVDHAQVRVTAGGAPVDFQWIDGSYLRVTGLAPSTRYTVTFPIAVRQLAFKQIRSQIQNWAESDYVVDPGSGQDYAFHDDAPENVYVGTFRGNTLVAVDHWPDGGIALYRGADRALWATLGAADATAPTHTSSRFRLDPARNFSRDALDGP